MIHHNPSCISVANFPYTLNNVWSVFVSMVLLCVFIVSVCYNVLLYVPMYYYVFQCGIVWCHCYAILMWYCSFYLIIGLLWFIWCFFCFFVLFLSYYGVFRCGIVFIDHCVCIVFSSCYYVFHCSIVVLLYYCILDEIIVYCCI